MAARRQTESLRRHRAGGHRRSLSGGGDERHLNICGCRAKDQPSLKGGMAVTTGRHHCWSVANRPFVVPRKIERELGKAKLDFDGLYR
jgi:hypothetical protein